MKKHTLLILVLTTLFLTSCIDDFEIDTPEGSQLIGINGYITNEYKKHQIVISRTADFYSDKEIEMISGAEVFISDGSDTIYLAETENKGYYETIDSVAGVIGTTYHLHVNIIDDEGEHKFYAQSTMRENTAQIDSLAIKQSEMKIMGSTIKTLNLYPYFQSVNDVETNYLINVAINDTLVYNSLIMCKAVALQGLSGMYFNGNEMTKTIGEQSAYTFETTSYNYDSSDGNTYETYIQNGPPYAQEGDVVDLYLYSITPEFNKYISDIKMNFGSNPMMGMPYNVSTNIYPEGGAVGFFEATSVVKSSIIY